MEFIRSPKRPRAQSRPVASPAPGAAPIKPQPARHTAPALPAATPLIAHPEPIRHLKPHTWNWRTPRVAIIGSLVTAGLVGALLTISLLHTSGSSSRSTTSNQSVAPPFSALTPATPVTWQRVSPPQNDPVFAYSSSISNVAITVSQQSLPASLKNNTSTQIADLAKAYNATESIISGDTTVYIGTSTKGPQSVIFTKKDLLVLIKSAKKIHTKAWARYIGTLH